MDFSTANLQNERLAMFHLLAFTKASPGGVTLEDVPGVQDSIFALNASSHYLPPVDSMVRFAATLSPNTTAAQISAPRFRDVALPAISPNDIGTAFTSLPATSFLTPPYIGMKANDELAVLMSDNAGAGIQKYCFLGVVDGLNVNVPPGNRFPLRATASITVGNKVWGAGTLTFDQTIPVGTYAVIGMDLIGANLLAGRLIFPGGGWRPGCLGRITEATKPEMMFRYGQLGEWGRFTNTAPPSIELFGNAAPTTQQVILDVVKVG